MGKHINPAYVGAFVLGAAGLLIGALLVFSGEQFISDSLRYTMYFEGSVKGLNVGAPVTFRGVKLGTVTNVQVSRVAGSDEIKVPVTVEIYASRVEQGDRYWKFNRSEVEEYMQELVGKGLRASIGLQSFVTGQLYVGLEFYPDAEPAQIELRNGYRVFPTVRSRFNVIAEELQELPIKDIVNQALVALQGINRVVNSEQLDESLQAIRDSAAGLDALIADLNKDLLPTIRHLDEAAVNANQLFLRTDRLVEDSADQLQRLLNETDALVSQAQHTIESYGKLTTNESEAGRELVHALRELSSAARSIRIMAEYLERHPEALIKGKGAVR
ncbi:MAG: MCE family protein [Thiogranum sp.]|nr:MCE family protein [Thiogranum sp.]